MIKTYQIALLPVIPNKIDTATLKFVYDSDTKIGVWKYAEQDLSLIFEREEIAFTNTDPLGRKVNKKLATATQINSSEWVNRFGNLFLNHEDPYYSIFKVLSETDDERKRLHFSGFKFDLISNEWFCKWEYTRIHCFLNSSHEYNEEIKLRLNLVTLTGYYIERDYTDVRG